jgi:C1A family cysteine protease
MLRRTLFLSAALLASVCAENLNVREFYEKAFIDWIEKFQVKIATGAEFVKRLQIFADNFDLIRSHNRGGATYTLALNEFAHLTHSEFVDLMKLGGTRIPNLRRGAPGAPLHTAPEGTANPTSVDWTTKGAVTPVKNQGSCGSCWAFSTTGSLEGAYEIKNGNLVSFSEQQLVSCDTTDLGCNGGWMDDAFAWAQKNGGLCTEDAYPYTSGNGQTGACKSTCSEVVGSAPSSWVDVTAGSVSALESAVAQQPVSIAIQANQPAFQFYSSGVLTGKCGQNLDHGVLAVGYGVYTDGTPYWKVKNSWGPSWGMDGYILIEKSSADLCGVLDAASYPVL